MKVVNESPFHAVAQVADLLTEELAGVVIVKATFDLHPNGVLSPSAEMMPLCPDPLETPYGELHGELFFKKRGVDLCVLGTVTRARSVPYVRLRLRVGERFVHELQVTGDRFWLPSGLHDELVPSEPVPFTQMPLGYGGAFGGRTDFEGMEAPYADNPVGRGWFATREQAVKGRLPNIEAVHDALRRWSDQPKVAGWGPYPCHWGLRASANVTVDPERYTVQHVDPGIFNHAHPDLVFDTLAPGTPISIEGLGEQPIRLQVPEPPADVTVRVGDDARRIAAPIDGVFVWADVGKLVITQRARFDYVFRREQLRQATVTMRAA